MKTFAELAASRRQWIDDVLIPWCRQACRKDLLAALQDWADIAGKVDPDKTLWFWAWSRFPGLVHDELASIDETAPVTITLADGTTASGFPDARESDNGALVLFGQPDRPGAATQHLGPFSIDDIAAIERS